MSDLTDIPDIERDALLRTHHPLLIISSSE